jgi:hypothetical protein
LTAFGRIKARRKKPENYWAPRAENHRGFSTADMKEAKPFLPHYRHDAKS